MKTRFLRLEQTAVAAALLGQSLASAAWAAEQAPFHVDYPAYLSSHDIVYLSPPTEGYEGFPLGNGDLGAMVWCAKSGLQIQINKNDTWEQPTAEAPMLLRSCGQFVIDFGAPCFEWLYLEGFEARLSLHDAEAVVAGQTPFLSVNARARVQADRNVVRIECQSRGQGDFAEGGAAARVALERLGSRAFPGWYGGIQRGAHLGLGKARSGTNQRDVWIQETLDGVSFAVVCRLLNGPRPVLAGLPHRHGATLSMDPEPEQQFTVLVAVATSHESPDPLAAALASLDSCERDGAESLLKRHRDFWRDFWRRSFVHVSDDYLENLYYLHLYLMGSASRGRYPAIFNGALFTWNHDVRQWVNPHHWNTQQAYWSLNAANHSELMRPYLDTYWRLMPKAEEYARGRGFTNAILWSEMHDFAGRMLAYHKTFTPASQIAQLFWDYYQFTGDEAFLRERAYPFMKRAAEFYLQYLKWNEVSKQYDIPAASAYEGPDNAHFRNTITDLAMIRVLFDACLRAGAQLKTDEDKRRQWRHVLDHLAPYPTTQTEGAGQLLAVAYERDGSVVDFGQAGYGMCKNTAPVFPAGEIGLSDRGSSWFDAALGRAKRCPSNVLAITPIAVVKARLGMADEAREDLLTSIRQLQHFPQGLFYNLDHWHYLSRYAAVAKNPIIDAQRDYIYDREARYRNINVSGQLINMPAYPFIQCGLEPSGILAAAVNEMLLQSHEDMIRVFPAAPKDWEAAFTLRARGGFLVSSRMEQDGQPAFVLVRSDAGRPCRLANPWPGRRIVVEPYPAFGAGVEAESDDQAIAFPTTAGAAYLARRADAPVDAPPFTFTGSPNPKPKRYHEAMLGKERDF
ncbi:MAG: hypothetical protein HY674_00855 [Chloroflexi bacterium]|nr:hypothetical protein [Chloroflexota bacterium]